MHVGEVELRPGDRLLVCSDGIHDNLTEAEIAQILRKPGRNDGEALVKCARKRAQRGLQATMRSKPDDMSAVVVDNLSLPAVPKKPASGKTQPTRKASATAKTRPAAKTTPTSRPKAVGRSKVDSSGKRNGGAAANHAARKAGSGSKAK